MRLDDPRATILNQPKGFGPGTIAVLCAETTRSQAFWFSLTNLVSALPDGLAQFRAFQGSDIPGLRNHAVETVLDEENEFGNWIWFIDDDHTFDTLILAQLAARNVDIVTPLVLRRQQPFYAASTDLDGDFLKIEDHEPDELVEVMFAGSSGMLIRRNVLDAIEPPWFPAAYTDEHGLRRSEDVNFCQRAVDAGFKIHVDMQSRMGHATTAIVSAGWDDDLNHWVTEFVVADGAHLKTGIFKPPVEEEDAPSAE